DGLVENLVAVALTQPAVRRQHADLAVVLADPTSLAAERPIVQMPQHFRPLASCPTRPPGRRLVPQSANAHRERRHFHRYPDLRPATPSQQKERGGGADGSGAAMFTRSDSAPNRTRMDT